MFAQGWVEIVDTQTGYKYSMVSRYPKDGNLAHVAKTERTG